MVECICFHPERRYTQEQLIDVLEVLPSSAKPVERHEVEGGDQPGLKLVAKTCSFINHCRENAETLPEPLWQAMIGNLSFFKGGDELKDRFELKASDAHALLSGFKKLSRSFAKWKEKNFQVGRELPPWYAHNGKKIEFHPGILAGHMAIMEPVIFSKNYNAMCPVPRVPSVPEMSAASG